LFFKYISFKLKAEKRGERERERERESSCVDDITNGTQVLRVRTPGLKFIIILFTAKEG